MGRFKNDFITYKSHSTPISMILPRKRSKTKPCRLGHLVQSGKCHTNGEVDGFSEPSNWYWSPSLEKVNLDRWVCATCLL